MIQKTLRAVAAMLAVMFIIIISATPSFAAVCNDEEASAQINGIKYKLIAVTELESDKTITIEQGNIARQKYIIEASIIAKKQLSIDEIMAYPLTECAQSIAQPSSDAQKTGGLLAGTNILYVIGGLLAIGAFTYLAWDSVRRLLKLFKNVPYLLYEIAIFALAIGVLAWGYTSSTNAYIAFIGALLVAGGLIFSGKIRNVEPDPTKFSFILLIIWAPLALVFNSAWIGFLAVAALLGLIGFMIIKTPKGNIGFQNESVIETTTLSGFIIMGFYVALHVLGKSAGYLHVFETGSLILGGIVSYCGLIFMSSRRYTDRKSSFAVMQVIGIIIGIGSILIGSVFGIGELVRIGGTFFVAYIFVKIIEIPKDGKRAWALVVLIAGAFLMGTGYTIFNNQEFFRPYILFLN